jgi:hypothetical protein
MFKRMRAESWSGLVVPGNSLENEDTCLAIDQNCS